VKVGSECGKTLLVGDNPFHNISHLSQERARVRGDTLTYPAYAANLVMTSLENGANGFMFSVSETTLSILREIRERGEIERLSLYAIVPYAYEYVMLATQLGGIPGLAKKFAKEIAMSGNVRAVAMGLKGFLKRDPVSLMKTYLSYEISRIKFSAGRQANPQSMLLHEVITDMALALNLDWLFKSYVDFMLKLGVTPGFDTGNFSYLVKKFREWSIDLRKVTIAAPFNKVGFQMNPSRSACEKTLANTPEPTVIAISILAAGYLSPSEAIDYIATLQNVKGVAVGVSKEKHARETFRLLKEKMG
jgi:hypothetical protein